MNLSEMLELIGGYKKKPAQQRSNKTVDDLYQSAKEIFDSDLDADFSTKLLSEKSGYSAGVIYRYFNKYEDIFIKLFIERVDEHLQEVEKIYLSHQPDESIDLLIKKIVDHGFFFLSKRSMFIRNLPVLFKFIARRLKEPDIVFILNDRFLPHLMELQKNDRTHTFEIMSEMECISRLRAFDLFLRVPFMISNNTFDLLEHKKSCYEFGLLIFSRNSNGRK